jgi:hypothetical protein
MHALTTRPGYSQRDPGHDRVYSSYEANRRRHAGILDLSSIPAGPTVSHLDLDLTLACNLRCTYCFKVKDNEHQDLQIALDAITWPIHASGPAAKLTVAMIGGEAIHGIVVHPRPVFHVFKYRGSHLLYDLASGSIVSLDAPTYALLGALEAGLSADMALNSFVDAGGADIDAVRRYQVLARARNVLP